MSLLERDDSLATLAGLLAEVRTEGRLLLVGGEAGVGKSTLLRRFCETADARVLWGACEPLRTPRPLGPLLDVAEATGGELAELAAGSPRPHEVAVALLDELRGRPTVLVLEDLHWADEATLDVVSLLVPRIAAVPALVLASYRDDELDRAEQLRVLLGELVRRPGRLKLAPLSPAAVAELAAPHGADAAELHRRTAGNPFFVVEALAAGGERIPDTVRDAVIGRAARLAEPARRLLDAVAIVPGPVELWLLEALAGELADHVDETSGMLIAGPAHVEFRHELARLAIDEATAPNRRLALHRAALAALGARGGAADAARLAHHADAAGDADAVLRWAPRAAARAAAAGAHREAAAQYARALRYAGALEPERRAELLSARAEECYTSADLEAAVDAQREALECHRQGGDRLGEGDAVRALSRLLFFAGRTGRGRAARARGRRAARGPAARPRAGDGLRQRDAAPRGRRGHRRGAGVGRPRARARRPPRRHRGAPLRAHQHRHGRAAGGSPRGRRAARGGAGARPRARPGGVRRARVLRAGHVLAAAAPVRARPSARSTPAWRTAPSAASRPGGCTSSAGRRGWRSSAAAGTKRPTAPPPSCATAAARRSRAAARCTSSASSGRAAAMPRPPRRSRQALRARGARPESSCASARSPPRAPRRRGWPATTRRSRS